MQQKKIKLDLALHHLPQCRFEKFQLFQETAIKLNIL